MQKTNANYFDGWRPMKFTDSGETFTKYSECYNKKLDKKFAADTNAKVKESYADFKSDGLKYF